MNMLNRRSFCLSSICAAGASFVAPATAQGQSLELAKILIGFPAGSGGDVVARRIAERLAPSYAKQVIIENRPGAGGQLAVTAVKGAPADGSTILFTPLAMVGVYPHTYRSLPYNTEADLTPVTLTLKLDVALAVGTAVPASVKSLSDFLEWTKGSPARASVGSPAPGSPLHFTIVELSRLSKVDLQHVAYRGTVAAIPDLLGGNLPAMVSPVGEFIRYVPEGKIRVLATSGSQRSRFIPQVPTFSEQGFKELEFQDYFGAYLPAKTPATQVQALNVALRQAMAHPQVKEAIDSVGLEAATGTPEELANTLRAYSQRWGAVVRATGFKAD